MSTIKRWKIKFMIGFDLHWIYIILYFAIFLPAIKHIYMFLNLSLWKISAKCTLVNFIYFYYILFGSKSGYIDQDLWVLSEKCQIYLSLPNIRNFCFDVSFDKKTLYSTRMTNYSRSIPCWVNIEGNFLWRHIMSYYSFKMIGKREKGIINHYFSIERSFSTWKKMICKDRLS